MLSIDSLTLCAEGRVLVRDLSMQVGPGERWAVLGPNGAGKSTLLAVCAGVRVPLQGGIRVLGDAVAQTSVGALAARRALMSDRWVDPFAATVLDTVLTARHYLGRPGAQDVDAAHQCLSMLDAQALCARDVRSLSRGERQRVALATTLAQETPLVLLDEPTAHQDPRHQVLVLDALCAPVFAQRAFVVSMHDMNAAARFATHVLLLTGHGGWYAGERSEVLTAERLSVVFGTQMDALVDPMLKERSIFFMARA